jgi:hypothetical protein
VRWVQPVNVCGVLEPQTAKREGTTLTATDIGVAIVRGPRRILVPWCNVKQADE